MLVRVLVKSSNAVDQGRICPFVKETERNFRGVSAKDGQLLDWKKGLMFDLEVVIVVAVVVAGYGKMRMLGASEVIVLKILVRLRLHDHWKEWNKQEIENL